MNKGDVIRFTRVDVRLGPKASVSYKARKDLQYVAVLLGFEPRDGRAPLDAEAALRALGWTYAEDTTAAYECVQALERVADAADNYRTVWSWWATASTNRYDDALLAADNTLFDALAALDAQREKP